MELTRLGAARLAALVRTREVSATEVARAHLDRHHRVDTGLNALVAVDPDQVLAQAAAVDATLAAGRPLGPLGGVPVGPKDNLDVRGEVTCAGSRAGTRAASEDAAAVACVRAAGAVLLGRGNMDELAMGASTQTSAFGATRHPWDARRSPGGSSGGSAAAVASGQLPLAVGTDTGGSIREPASQCGVVGMAPSVGLVPTGGAVPFAPALDRVGPLARTVADARLLLEVLSGQRLVAPDPARALRIGLVAELAGPRNRPGVLAVLTAATGALMAAGHDVVPVSVASASGALDVYSVVTAVDSLPVLERYAATGEVGVEVLRRLDLAREVRAAGRERAARAAQARLGAEVTAALAGCDLLLSPTMPTTAPVIHDVDVESLTDPLGAPYTDCWTVVANLAGVPALSVPGGLSPDDDMPVGVMLMGPPGSDALLLGVGELIERG